MAASLERVFSSAAIFTTAQGEVDSFSSTSLADPSQRVLDTIDKFADRLLREVDEHEGALVIGIDDLELDNTATVTLGAVLRAVGRRLAFRWSDARSRERAADRLRQRCSFHLAVPLVEAYFFGEEAALERAGAVIKSRFDAVGGDIESFSVDDEKYLAEPELTREFEPNPERRKRTWAKPVERRRRHPKLYLKYLCSPDDPRGDRYREACGGKRALESLDWRLVAANPLHARFARSLFVDVADFIGLPTPLTGEDHPLTSLGTHRLVRTLRNL